MAQGKDDLARRDEASGPCACLRTGCTCEVNETFYIFTLVSLLRHLRTDSFINLNLIFYLYPCRRARLYLRLHHICRHSGPPGPLTGCLLGRLQMFGPPAGLITTEEVDNGQKRTARGREKDNWRCWLGGGVGWGQSANNFGGSYLPVVLANSSLFLLCTLFSFSSQPCWLRCTPPLSSAPESNSSALFYLSAFYLTAFFSSKFSAPTTFCHTSISVLIFWDQRLSLLSSRLFIQVGLRMTFSRPSECSVSQLTHLPTRPHCCLSDQGTNLHTHAV